MRRPVVLLGLALLLGAAPAPAQQKYGLVIGIAGYPEFREGERLRYADRDANAFADFLASPRGYGMPAANIRRLINQAAIRDSIDDALVWLRQRVLPGDVVIVFFAGHGVTDDNDRAYLMPWDAAQTRPTRRGWPIKDFLERLDELPSHLMFFLDACHSGAAMNNGLARDGGNNVARQLMQVWDTLLGRRPNTLRMGIAAAEPTQRSFEDTTLQHGIFSYYLMRGLRGAADSTPSANKDGKVEAGELWRYLQDSVSSFSKKRHTAEQNPLRTPTFDSRFPLSMFAQLRNELLTLQSAGDFQQAMNEGTAAFRSRNWPVAISLLRQALGYDSGAAQAHYMLGYALQQTVDSNGALASYQRALRLDGRHFEALMESGRISFERRQYSEAERAWRRAATIRPGDAWAQNNLGAAVSVRDVDSALVLYNSALRLDPSYLVAHRNRGLVLLGMGDHGSAIASFRRALDLSPGDTNLTRLLRDATERQQSLQRRVQSAREAAARDTSRRKELHTILHEEAFDFPAAMTVIVATLRGPTTPDSRRIELAENAITAGQTPLADTLTGLMLQLPTIEPENRAVLLALQIVVRYARGQPRSADSSASTLAALIAAQPDSFRVGWRFDGLKYHIRSHDGYAPYRSWLIRVLTALESRGREAILAELPRQIEPAGLSWIKCGSNNVWCSLANLNLDHEHFNSAAGVFVVWRPGPPEQVLYVGSGGIRAQVIALRQASWIQNAGPGLLITWSNVASELREGIAEYLVSLMRPQHGQLLTGRQPTPANRPW